MMKKKYWAALLLSFIIGLSACQSPKKIKAIYKLAPDPTRFGLGVSSEKSKNEIESCFHKQLLFSGLKVKKHVENIYPKHNVYEYHIRGYKEILRIVDRNAKRQVFFTYNPENTKHHIIFSIVDKCIFN